MTNCNECLHYGCCRYLVHWRIMYKSPIDDCIPYGHRDEYYDEIYPIISKYCRAYNRDMSKKEDLV